jgi:sulfide:quinone oxidoreductase
MSRTVLIAGGGVGGLEAALALRAAAAGLVSIRLIASEPHFVYRPLAVGVPFGGASTVRVELAAMAADAGFELVLDRLVGVDLDGREVTTEGAGGLRYDDLVLALGARQKAAIPAALTFRGPRDVGRFRRALDDLAARGGGRIAFVARAITAWTLPLYELAVLTADWAAGADLDIRIMLVTPERTPLEALGPEAGEQIAEVLAGRRIDLYSGAVPGDIVDGALSIPIEGRIEADLIVALPVLVGPEVPGLPRDELGFVPVDAFCRIEGARDAYAIGDMTTHPVKQGGLAAQQADVAAACIAAAAGALVRPQPYEPVLRALMFTGGTPLYLRQPGAEASGGAAGEETTQPWWPPHKIMGAHLAPYLASHAELLEPGDSP